MAKNFLEIIESIKKVPFSVLITNGTLLNEVNISKIIEAGLGRLMISFDGAKKETFEKIRRGADFEKIISNIELINNLKENLSSPRPEVCFSTTLMRSNIEEFPLIVQLAYQLKINIISCKPVQILFPEMEAENLDNFSYLTARYFNQAQKLANELGVKLEPTPDLSKLIKKDKNLSECANEILDKTYKVKSCGEYLPILFISPDGKVKPCTMWGDGSIGDFKIQNFRDIWEGNEFKRLITQVESGNFSGGCLKCRYLV
jgi:radical SAM protein with 4Fe4S-binding SPASM domain